MKNLLLAAALLTTVAAVAGAQSDVVTKLGSTIEEAHDTIFSAFSTGNVTMTGTSEVFKAANAQARAAMVTSIVTLARAYTTSADFTKRWATYREEQKPEPPSTSGPTTAAGLEAEQRKGLEAAIAGMEQVAKQMPQMKKELDGQIAELRKQIAALGKDKAASAQMDALMKQGAQMEAAEYKQRLAEWEKTYPVDPKPFVVKRLRDFLAMSATVDYTAKLTKARDGMMKFDNPEYERKDSQWKYMYRAGKPAVDAARTLAQEWLKALGG